MRWTVGRAGLMVAAIFVSGCEQAGPKKALEQAGELSLDECVQRCRAVDPGNCQPTFSQCTAVCRTGNDAVPEVITALEEAPPEAAVASTPALLGSSIGIETLGGVFTPLVDRCTPLPAEHAEIFSTAADNQTSVEIHLLTGNAPKAVDNRTLGNFSVTEIRPAPRGAPRIKVTLAIDATGYVRVGAHDADTGAMNEIDFGAD